MLIAQITDMHVKTQGEMLSGTLDSYAGLQAAVGRIAALEPRPDLLVATGDLTADGTMEEYAALRGLLDGLDIPYLLLPGNHDVRDNLRAAFPDQPWEEDATPSKRPRRPGTLGGRYSNLSASIGSRPAAFLAG